MYTVTNYKPHTRYQIYAEATKIFALTNLSTAAHVAVVPVVPLVAGTAPVVVGRSVVSTVVHILT